MAIPPTVPTSFVPRQSGPTLSRRPHFDFGGAFAAVCYFILFLTLALAGGLFGYQKYIENVQVTKDAAVKEAESKIDPTTAATLIRLRDRLASGKTLLNSHPAFSGIFGLLERLTPQAVRFSSLHVTLSGDHGAVLAISGTAASLNTLAVASQDLGNDSHFKDAIFSGGGTAAKGGAADFSLSAKLDSSLFAFTLGADTSGVVPVATSTATTSPQSTTP